MAEAQDELEPDMSVISEERNGLNINDVQWKPGRYVGDISSVDECEEAMAALSLTISAIEGQIANAKHLAASSEMYSDRIWWRRVNSAVKINKVARQYVQDMRGRMARELKRANVEASASRDKRLIQALRDYVGEQAFLRIATQVE